MNVIDLQRNLTPIDKIFTKAVGVTQNTLVKLTVALQAKSSHEEYAKWQKAADKLYPRLKAIGLEPERLWWGPMTLTPKKTNFLLDEIERLEPKQALEVGAGTSTAVLAAAANHYGFELTSLENHPGTISYIESLIGDLPCAQKITLQKCGFQKFIGEDAREYRWYNADLSQIADPIDFVLVDGPMGSLVGRNGAMHQILPYLHSNHGFYLDDCKRSHEQKCVEEWKKHYPGVTALIPPNVGMFSIQIPAQYI